MRLGLTLAAVLAAVPAAAEELGAPLDVPLVESPYNIGAGAWPSMRQSLGLTSSAYEVLHAVVGRRFDPFVGGWRGFGHIMIFVGIDVLAAYLPLGDAWLHEEYHRAVLGRRGIDSFNDVYRLEIGGSVIRVSHVKDEDLVALKRDHPEDMVRLPAAGIEGETQLIQTLGRNAFFLDARNFHTVLALTTLLNVHAYVSSGPEEENDEMTDEMNEEEDSVEERDFVGHDFASWVYDLFRPDEPYEARGVHPSGVGLNRYRRASDLSARERDYLAWMGRLSWLNLIDPFVFGIPRLEGPGFAWTASTKHFLTSFGFAVDANALYRQGDLSLAATVSHYRNASLATPGLSLELVRWPLAPLLGVEALSFRAAGWLQPKRQRFDDDEAKAGGLGAVRAHVPLSRGEAWVELESKGAGWVAGNPYLEPVTVGRLGVAYRL